MGVWNSDRIDQTSIAGRGTPRFSSGATMLHKSHVFRCRQDVLAHPEERRLGHRHSGVELWVRCTHKYPKAAAGGNAATSLSQQVG